MGIGRNKKHGVLGFEDDYFNDENKIELKNCKGGGKNCKELLSFINKSYTDYYRFYRLKDYNRSVKALERAYMNSFDLQQPQCLKCADLFRNMMIQSLEEMHGELRKKTNGFFNSRRNQSNFEIIDKALNKLKQREDSIS